MNTPGIILYPELSFLLRYTPSLSTPILQDFWAPVMPTCYPNIWRETSVERKYKEANDGEYWGCTAGVGHGNRGSRDYEECNIPEIDTSDSPDIQEGREGGLMSGQRLKLVWGGKVGTKDTQETWEWDSKVSTQEIARDTVLK